MYARATLTTGMRTDTIRLCALQRLRRRPALLQVVTQVGVLDGPPPAGVHDSDRRRLSAYHPVRWVRARSHRSRQA